MNKTAIRERLRASPFQAFDIVMNNGDRFRVEHPEFAVVTAQSTVHWYPRVEDDPEFPSQSFRTLSVVNISSLDPAPVQESAGR